MLLRLLRQPKIIGRRCRYLSSKSINYSDVPKEPEEEEEEEPELFDLPLHTTVPVPINNSSQNLTWNKQPGDRVQLDEIICENEQDQIKSHVDGYLAWSSSSSSSSSSTTTSASISSPSVSNGTDITGERAPLAILVSAKEDVSAFETFQPLVEKRELVYDGLFGSLIRRVKIISVSSCGLTMLSMPMLALFGDESVPLGARCAVAGVVMFFGAGTTATVHWMCHPYITQMWRNTQDHYTAESINMFGRRKYTNFVANDVVMADSRPFSTFKLEPYNKNYYVHTEDDCWRPDEEKDFFYTRDDD